MNETPIGSVAIHSAMRHDALAAQVEACGWVVDPTAAIALVDRVHPAAGTVSAPLIIALSDLSGPDAAWDAYHAGATHWLPASYQREDLRAALALADRCARRLSRGEDVDRRDLVPSEDEALAAWFAAHRGEAISAIVVVLTRYEFVNAAYGRPAGDALMAAVAERIAGWAREEHGERAILRRDGTEFVVLAATAPGGETIGRLDHALARPFDVEGAAASLGTRIGSAAARPNDSLAALLARARRGLGQPSGELPDHGRIDALAGDLHHAIERGEIAIRYQPQVGVATGAIVGVEALARWDHPVHGALGAADLFAAAERADLGNALSDHIQRVALEEAAAWPPALARLRVSVNVTAEDLGRPGFADAFLARIAASGVARGRVTVEIVETGLMDDLDRAAAILARLRGAGCRIAIDDFGTGYSSLAYLKALPIDYLKIDRSLTRDISGSERDRVIVRGVIAIARSLGLETIAEGVETEAERLLLAAEGCDLYQGFLCSEPVDGHGLAALIA